MDEAIEPQFPELEDMSFLTETAYWVPQAIQE